ncbi:dTMP kinase [Jannaschia sp. R86511]|uniref:dTMP kinase n=1 Tax=Jannaschia sp. R86511 TaxID=3093853 RepID=UPI0036D3E0CE
MTQTPPAPEAPQVSDDLDGAPDHSPRAVLRHTAFRQLWLVLGLSSFGDWLGLLAITFFATQLVGGTDDIAAAGLAVSVVFILRLAPALLLGPIAGVLADRLDRRLNLVVGDVVRGLLFLSIPVVGTLEWLYVATVLIEVAALFWMPAKDAMVPNLVPRRRLEAANQLGVIATYGTAPLAALAFVLISMLSQVLDDLSGGFASAVLSEVDLALYVNAATYLTAAVVIARLPLPEAAKGPAVRAVVTDSDGVPAARPSLWRQIVEGWAFIARTPVVRGLVGGMIGAFAAGGFVIGLGIVYAAGLGAGAPGYGVLFGAVFLGMALGVWQGPRTLRDVSRRRLFGASIGAAGAVLVVVGLSPDIVLSAVGVLVLGFFAGMAWVTGMTLLGGEVDDEVRGRTFAFVQTAVRVVLIAVMAAGPWLATQLVGERSIQVSDGLTWTLSGAGIVMSAAGLLAVVVGVLTFRLLDDRPGLSLRAEVTEAVRRGTGDPLDLPRPHEGFFVVVEGGDGAGKSTLASALGVWLTDELGHEVVLTREPGGTAVGNGVRRLVLDWDDTTQGPGPVPRAEALLFAADRAQHVATVVEPALAGGAVVVSDRYVDSSVAYQGARGDLAADEVARLSRWATDGLRADLTVVLDLDPGQARARMDGRDGVGVADRVESAGSEFHASVRSTFLRLAGTDARRYLVVDAGLPPEEVLDLVTDRLRRVLPLSARRRAAAAARLAAEAEARTAREREAVQAAEAEDAERARVREQLAQAERMAEKLKAEQAAAEAERRRQVAEEARAARQDSDTAVIPAVRPADHRYPADQYGSDQYAPGAYAAEEQAADQYATDQYGTDQYATDQYGTDQYATDQYGTDQYGTDQYATDQYATDEYPTQGYEDDRGDLADELYGRPAEGSDVDETRPQRIELPDDAATGASGRWRRSPGQGG